MNVNTLKTLHAYRHKSKDYGPYFIHHLQKQILEKIVLKEKQINYLRKIDPQCNLQVVKSYVKNYCMNENFNFFIIYPSIKNLFKVFIDPYLLKKNVNIIQYIIILIKYKLYLLKNLTECNLFALTIIFRVLLNIKRNEINKKQLIYFHDLRKNQTISKEIQSYLDFCLLDNDINPQKRREFYSSNDIGEVDKKNNLPNGDFLKSNQLLSFIKRLLKLNLMFFHSFFDNQSYLCMLYKEFFKKIIVDISLKNFNDCSIIFDNSYMGFTPPWSRGKNRKNFLIFYSTNFGYNFDNKKHKFLFPIEYELMNWDNIYVWDDIQKEVLSQFNIKTNYKIIKKINFIDNAKTINFDKHFFNIIIFDVTPKNLISIVKGLNLGDYFYSNRYMIKFINNIVSFNHKNIKFFIKQKRKIESISKGYSKNLNRLVRDKKLNILDEAISPERIIMNSNLVICPVYSTPSLIAKSLNIPSIYYDPQNRVEKKFIYRRNIEIINGKSEIETYILNSYEKWKVKN